MTADSNDSDIRWLQRLSNFNRALLILDRAVALSKERELTELEEQGLIQSFEFTHELAWNVLKDFFEYQGASSISGSRDATREAFNKGLITDGDNWMEMIKSRNKTTHTHNESTAKDISKLIRKIYYPLFTTLSETMESHRSGGQGELFNI